MSGTIAVVYGPSQSGKTFLLRSMTTADAKNGATLVVFGIRHENSPPAHPVPEKIDSEVMINQSEWNVANTAILYKLHMAVIPPGTTTIAIDDGHLFPDLYVMTTQWARMGLRVVTTVDSTMSDLRGMMNGAYNGASEASIERLLRESEGVVRLLCKKCQGCNGLNAEFTIIAGHPSLLVPFSGLEGPIHVCRRCVNKATGHLYN